MSSNSSNYPLTLAYMILNGIELNSDFYPCPANYSLADEQRVKRPILGAYFLGSGVVLVTLYLLCLFSMLSRDLLRCPAFKIMVSLAISDIPSVMVNSIATGILGINGITFCDYPRLIFFLGSNGFGWWLGCSLCCISLALCRISEINPGLRVQWLFHGPAMNLLLLLCFLAPGYGILLTKPVIFRPEFMSWFFDPGLGLNPSYYTNLYQPINNAILTVITLSLYAYLVSFIVRETHSFNASIQVSKAQKQVILQIAIICFFHSITSFLYVYMQFFYSPEWLIVIAQLGWQICTGSVSIIYLTLNTTIRAAVRKMLFPWKIDNRVSYITESTC